MCCRTWQGSAGQAGAERWVAAGPRAAAVELVSQGKGQSC